MASRRPKCRLGRSSRLSDLKQRIKPVRRRTRLVTTRNRSRCDHPSPCLLPVLSPVGLYSPGAASTRRAPEPPDPELATEGEPSDALMRTTSTVSPRPIQGSDRRSLSRTHPVVDGDVPELSTAAVRDAGVAPNGQTATPATNGSVEICYEASELFRATTSTSSRRTPMG